MPVKRKTAAKKATKKKTTATKSKKTATKARKAPMKTKAAKTTKRSAGTRGSGGRGGNSREKRTLAIREKLLQQKKELLDEAGLALNALPDESAFPDMGDQATAEIDRNFMLRLRGREQKLLKKIELAIEKIDSGAYGICEVCGCEIGIKRLEVRPVTTMCIECKTEQEEEEKLLEV